MNLSLSPANFEINFGDPMRQYHDSTNDVKVWHELIDLLDQVTIQSSQGPIKITLDWRNAKQFIAEWKNRVTIYEEMRGLDDIKNKYEEYFRGIKDGSAQDELVISCSILSPPHSDNKQNINYVIYFLHLIFLAMNLASPGSCDFWKTTIRWKDESQGEQTSRTFLEGIVPELAAQKSNELQWPPLEIIPIRKVWNWLQSLSISEASFSRSNVERAVFAMLHVCTDREENISQADLVWLAHALESLFDTPESGISKALRDRIFLVLGTPSTNLKRIKKMLTSFYDLRSAFVHGDSEIPNPMYHRSTDEKYDNLVEEMTKHKEFVLLIVIATLQKMIANNWHAIEFSEQYSGVTVNQTQRRNI